MGQKKNAILRTEDKCRWLYRKGLQLLTVLLLSALLAVSVFAEALEDRAALAKKCNSNYGYQDLVNNIKNADMVALYEAIDESQEMFFLSDSPAEKAGDGEYTCGTVAIPGDLTYDQVSQVLGVYRMDHPLYYWLSGTLIIHSDAKLQLVCYEEYADPQARGDIHDALVTILSEFEAYLEGSTSNYTVATASVYKLAQIVDYAYDENGEPEDASWAHSIVGVVNRTYGEVVCEGYAKFYQLLMNYFGVPNVYVVGQANGNTGNTGEMVLHAWNLVQMDDGQYYWTDPTWSDVDWRLDADFEVPQIADPSTISDYRYRVRYIYHLKGDAFYEDHWPLTPDNVGELYLYALPVTAQEAYLPDLIGEPAAEVMDGCGMRPEDTISLEDISFGVLLNDGLHREVEIGWMETWDSTDLVIPSEITYNGVTYQVVGMNLTGVDWDMKTVTLPEGLRYIHGLINYDISATETIFIPSTVEYIQTPYLSHVCLEEIIVAQNNPYIKSVDGVMYTKDGKTLLRYPLASPRTKFYVPSTVTELYTNAFFGNKYLQELILSDSIKTIGSYALSATESLTFLEIPSSVEFLPDTVFASVYSMFGPDMALSQKSSLKTIRVSANTKFAPSAFNNVWSLENLEIEEGNPSGYIYDGALYCREVLINWTPYETVLVMYPGGREADTVVVKEDCDAICPGAFSYSTRIGTVVIPDNCTVYPDAFLSSGVESLKISDNNTSIYYRDGAIYTDNRQTLAMYLGGARQTSFTVPDTVSRIGSYAFYRSRYLKNITMSDSVTEVLAYAFAQCTALEHIRLSDAIAWTRDIGDYVDQYYSSIFEGCTSLKEVTLPKASTHVPYWMFHMCTSLEKVVFPENIQTIGEGVFVNAHVKELYIYNKDILPKGKDYWETPAGDCFIYPYGLGDTAAEKTRTVIYGHPDASYTDFIHGEENKRLVFRDLTANVNEQPDSGRCGDDVYWRVSGDVLTISGSGPMYNYFSGGREAPWLWRWGDSIKTVIIEEGVTTIGDGAFFLCGELDQVVIPDGVARIGEFGFAGCSMLTEIDLPKTVNYIGRCAFNRCTGIESIDFPEGVFLEYMAFYNCTGLTEVYIPAGVESLYNVFMNCENLETITLGKTLDGVQFDGCPSLRNVYIAHDGYANYLKWLIESFESYKTKPTIYCCRGTWAAMCCEEWNYPFVDVHGTEHCERFVEYGPPGDINGDGKVNNKDASCLFQHLSGWDVEVNEALLDINGDGKVNNKDASLLFQYLSGWDVEIA